MEQFFKKIEERTRRDKRRTGRHSEGMRYDGRLWTKLAFFFHLHNFYERKLVIVKDCQRSEICDRRKSTIFNNLAESSTIFHLQFGFGSIYNLRSLAILHFVGLYVWKLKLNNLGESPIICQILSFPSTSELRDRSTISNNLQQLLGTK